MVRGRARQSSDAALTELTPTERNACAHAAYLQSMCAWDQEAWEAVQPLRRHLQFVLVGSLHYAYVDAAAEAIELVGEGRGDENVAIPWEQPLTSALYRHLLIDRDVAKASDLVEAWDLERFVGDAVPSRDSEEERPR